MTIRLASRLVSLSNTEGTVCPIQVRQITTETIGVNILSCCYQKDAPCIPQSAARTFQCADANQADYTAATEITFDVWDKPPGVTGATNLLSKSLTGATITLPNDYTFEFNVTNAESAALKPGEGWYEAWVTQSGGDRRLVGAGPFKIVDTRKFDA